jgi:hypothetical protein
MRIAAADLGVEQRQAGLRAVVSVPGTNTTAPVAALRQVPVVDGYSAIGHVG